MIAAPKRSKIIHDWIRNPVLSTALLMTLLAMTAPTGPAWSQSADPQPGVAPAGEPPPVDPPPPPPLPGLPTTDAGNAEDERDGGPVSDTEASTQAPSGGAGETGTDEAPIPPKANTSDELLPVVRIRQEEDRMVEEYLNNGVVYMVRIVPKNAPPYYLMDTDGDGELDTRQEESDPGIKPVYWKLLEWD